MVEGQAKKGIPPRNSPGKSVYVDGASRCVNEKQNLERVHWRIIAKNMCQVCKFKNCDLALSPPEVFLSFISFFWNTKLVAHVRLLHKANSSGGV